MGAGPEAVTKMSAFLEPSPTAVGQSGLARAQPGRWTGDSSTWESLLHSGGQEQDFSRTGPQQRV